MTRVVAAQNVTNTASKILTTKGGSAEEPDWFIIQNNASDETVYIAIVLRGTTGGTATANNTHFPIAPGGSIQVNSVSPEDVWAYSANGAPVSIITRF